MNFLYKHEKVSKLTLLMGLVLGSVGVVLTLDYLLHSNMALVLNVLGLSYLFIGSLIFADSVGRWGTHKLWTYKYGSLLQGLGFVTSLTGIMAGEGHFRLPVFKLSPEWATADASIALAFITLVGVGYAILQYQFNKRDRDERERPYVFVDLESINNSSLFNLVIRNTGSSPAKHIKVEFTPDIKLHEYSESTINNMKVMQDMKFLAPGKTLLFFFGSIIGGNTPICQEFKLKLTYKSVKNKEFTEEQTIDPRDFLGLSHISEKSMDDIGKSLEVIAKSLASSAKYQEEMADNLVVGVTPRNANLNAFTEGELKAMLINIVKYGHKYELVLGRPSEDTKAVVRALRDKLLIKGQPSLDDQAMITRLSSLLMERFPSGGNDFEADLKALAGESDQQPY